MAGLITTRRGWERRAQEIFYAVGEALGRLEQQGLIESALGVEGLNAAFREVMPDAKTADMVAMDTLGNWARNGLQTVCMPATYAAALMATDCSGAIGEQPMPWPAFCVDVTAPLVDPQGRRVVCAVVHGQNGGERMESVGGVQVSVTLHFDDGAVAWGRFLDLADLARADAETLTPDGEPANASKEFSHNDRLWLMVGRLIAGAVLTINQHRESRPGAYRAAPRTKRGVGRSNVWIVGKALKLDCRQSVADFVNGTRRTLSTQHLRRGHWRNQTHGPANALRRLQWIQPCWVGEGPTLVRPVVIGTSAPVVDDETT